MRTDSSVRIRSADDADWPAIARLDATCFGVHNAPETFRAWRSLIPADGSVLACDGDDVVGMAHYLDLTVTVPGGAVLPMAGVTLVAVAPTHRRRGLLRAMFAELHDRIERSYPIAGLTASEGGIYGRFGYGAATIEQELTVDRRTARFRDDAPDPGGVRIVAAAEHRDALAAIYERWRTATPGGLQRPAPLWDEMLADRGEHRRGGSAWFTLLHPDGYALYRVFGDDPMFVRVAELIAVTDDAHVALCRALCGLDLMQTVRFATHPADPLPYLLTDARSARLTHHQDDLWLRIVDIPAALQARNYRADVSTVLAVTDGFRGSGGRFALQIRDGRAQCTATDAPADVELDLDVLGSLFLGGHRAPAFAAANRLRCKDSDLLASLGDAFASDVPAVLGFGF
ncbi:GNAT family N-acetyltransferase [Mycolicibacterium flavescens]|uniref:GNAT family N-acetyltransferase n=1 Tax=Mycolicibacterium flavescens TaxID=1776 RepID=A0A1E3RL29_MYCFV|nr:GNAT family N-acetyltransferase [Mycolicibacterium flavescens]